MLILPPILITAPPNNVHLIVPGRSVGVIDLDENYAHAERQLGEPNGAQFGVTSKVWKVWRDEGHELDVYIGDRSKPGTIQEIRFDSPLFHTRKGLHVGLPLDRFLHAYPNLFADPTTHGTFYEDRKSGFGVEISPESKVTAIIIHPKGRRTIPLNPQ